MLLDFGSLDLGAIIQSGKPIRRQLKAVAAHRFNDEKVQRIAEYMVKAWPVMAALREHVGEPIDCGNGRGFKLEGARVDTQGWLVVWGTFWRMGGIEMTLHRKEGEHQEMPLMFRSLPPWDERFASPLECGVHHIRHAVASYQQPLEKWLKQSGRVVFARVLLKERLHMHLSERLGC